MLLPEFEAYLLEVLCHDHQSIATIRAVREVPTGEAKTIDALFRLGRLGLVQTYTYDNRARSYAVVQEPLEEESLSYWFLATEAGRRLVERNGPFV